jgi:hypothetical protein
MSSKKQRTIGLDPAGYAEQRHPQFEDIRQRLLSEIGDVPTTTLALNVAYYALFQDRAFGVKVCWNPVPSATQMPPTFTLSDPLWCHFEYFQREYTTLYGNSEGKTGLQYHVEGQWCRGFGFFLTKRAHKRSQKSLRWASSCAENFF